MRKFSFLLLLFGFLLNAQTQKDSIQFKRLSDEILVHGTAYENLRELTKDIGHRMSGSEGYAKATVWAEEKLKQAGVDRVWLQEVMVPFWVRGKESLKVKVGKSRWNELGFLSLGNSEGTGGKDVEGEVIMVNTFDEFEQLSDAQVKDKIVFFNYKFRQDFVQTFKAYGDAGKYRFATASMVARKGGKFVIIRSISSGDDDVPHTGMLGYDEKYAKIPAVAVGNHTADWLEASIKKDKVYLKLNSNCGMQGEVLNHSVIGEIKGETNEFIVLGAHLDSWDVGEGAHDDGAGIVQIIEIARAFKALGYKPKHSIRFVCYANEENGAQGGVQYATEAKRKNETHIFAIESDAGGFTPRGISLDMDEAKRKQIQSWASLFLPYDIYDFSGVYGGVDINPLKYQMGVPVAGLTPDSQRYFDIHHTAADTFEQVNKRELLLGAVAMAQMVYMIDQNW